MAHRTVHRLACLLTLLAVTSSAKKDQSRWSRQISTYTSDISDWVPLSSPVEREPEPLPPIKRQAVAEPRILTEPFPGLTRPTGFGQDSFPSRNYYNAPANRQLYLQSVPSAPQNYLTDQGFGQGIRFGLSQPNFPLSQGFVAPPFGFDGIQPQKPRLQGILNPVSFNQALPGPSQAKPFLSQSQKSKSEPKLVDGYRAENVSNDFSFNVMKAPQSLQKIKFDTVDKPVRPEALSPNSKNEREEVQLLYVPLESLNRGQFNFRSPLTTSQIVNKELYSQVNTRLNPMKQTFISDYQRPGSKPLEQISGHNYFSEFNSQLKDVDQVPKYSTIPTPFPTQHPTTPKPKKLKPHQPPLAIFMTKEVSKNSQVKVGDVLSSLKNANTIAVLDSVNPLNAPKVFIGPSTLSPPENFVKFELPYLSNIENSDKKLKQLPFFVAPLSYNTPNGFAKIPFPSPHVGSVVINSQIRDSSQPQAPSHQLYNQNYYTVTQPSYKHEKPVTQKPTFSYYSTAAPKPNPVPNYQSNYYSFEPQTVSTIRPPKQPDSALAPPKTGSYFISNMSPQYNSQEYNFQPQNDFKSSEVNDQYNNFQRKPDHTTTLRTTTTTTTTTKPPSTYPSQLLETHNPYSINQAFHFSTPLDYHNYFDDVKQPYPTRGAVGHSSPSPSPSPTPSPTPSPPPSPTPAGPSSTEPQPEQIITQKPKYQQQSSPSYLQNYTPEIHYDSDPNLKYPVFNPTDYFAKTELTSQQTQPSTPVNTDKSYPTNNYNQEVATPVRNNYNQDVTTPIRNNYNTDVDSERNNYNTEINTPVNNNYNTDVDTQLNTYKTEYNQNVETQSTVEQDVSSEHPTDANDLPAVSDIDTPPKYSNEYNAYQTNLDAAEVNPTSSSTTTTTTTRRTPHRIRGRPRYTTTPRSESYESTAKVVVTRRPLRERRPLSSRPRYEPNKITTEKPSRKLLDSSESTTKSTRQRIRGRIHYKPSENEDIYDRRVKTHNTKEADLAYQRDVLHQNYPVTLMERVSTVDIEAMTEPTPKETSDRVEEPITENDTENAYTNEKASISHHFSNTESKEETALPTFTARSTLPAETSYVPNVPSTRQEYFYQSRSSIAPVESSAYEEASPEKEEDIYVKQTTPVSNLEYAEISSYTTETPSSPATEQSVSFSISNEYATVKQDEEPAVAPETEDAKKESQEQLQIEEEEEEENVVQTTPSYNRVRVRPGVIRQYHQASTESSRNKEIRRPAQPVTYRPAFDRRRTTMRIDEIEADLKTKQVHARPEVQEIRHPVYRPEPTTEPSGASPPTTEGATKRGQFRRRRPSHSYTTTSTESSSTKRIYEVKNRFRGRRPTEKPTDKPDVQTEAPTSTTRSQLHTRYSHRPRLSERYNKKPESEETEDQDSNFSINRPKYAEPDTDQWSPKISSDSFKPYNPNDIVDEQKIATTERRSDNDSELDIITARNEFEDILLTVTPASNRANKKIPEIPPTLEALVEQSKVTRSDSTDAMSTFESMLEEVMKSLEEQDQDEYTKNVMKHKGGEIGEIPPERIISSGDTYVQKSTTPTEEITTEQTTADDSSLITEDDQDRKGRRRGFWKKVKVRPATTESIEFAESQYYTHTVNRLGQPVKQSKNVHDKSERIEKPKVTTYKPSYSFIKDLFSGDDEANIDVIPTVDIPKLTSKPAETDETLVTEESKQTTVYVEKETQTDTALSPGDFDLGTGSPDPTIDDIYLTTTPEPTTTSKPVPVNRPDAGFSFMDYLFGTSSDSEDNNKQVDSESEAKTTETEIQITTESPKPRIVTTESAFIPDEMTAASISDENTEAITAFTDIKKLNNTEQSQTESSAGVTEISVVKVESSSVSSFMNPANVVSTSMSTEVSHETEICFRGKCIKTSKDIL